WTLSWPPPVSPRSPRSPQPVPSVQGVIPHGPESPHSPIHGIMPHESVSPRPSTRSREGVPTVPVVLWYRPLSMADRSLGWGRKRGVAEDSPAAPRCLSSAYWRVVLPAHGCVGGVAETACVAVAVGFAAAVSVGGFFQSVGPTAAALDVEIAED